MHGWRIIVHPDLAGCSPRPRCRLGAGSWVLVQAQGHMGRSSPNVPGQFKGTFRNQSAKLKQEALPAPQMPMLMPSGGEEQCSGAYPAPALAQLVQQPGESGRSGPCRALALADAQQHAQRVAIADRQPAEPGRSQVSAA